MSVGPSIHQLVGPSIHRLVGLSVSWFVDATYVIFSNFGLIKLSLSQIKSRWANSSHFRCDHGIDEQTEEKSVVDISVTLVLISKFLFSFLLF